LASHPDKSFSLNKLFWRLKLKKTVLYIFLIAVFTGCATTKTKPHQESPAQAELEKALLSIKYGLVERSITFSKEAINLDPRMIEAYNTLGYAYMTLRNFNDAIYTFNRCIEINPNYSEAYNNLGVCYKEIGKEFEAESSFKKAIAIDSNPNSAINLAEIYFKKGDYDSSLEYLENALIKNPISAQALNDKALIYIQKGRTEEAIALHKQALLQLPQDLNLQFNLAEAYFRNSDFQLSKGILLRIKPQAKSEELKNKIESLLKLLDREYSGPFLPLG
jgi:tetratricopeptide (TPR) repeat protein